MGSAADNQGMKHKSLVCWLGVIVGPLGIARFYMYGWRDSIGWSLSLMTLLGVYGFERAQSFGLDDPLSWWLAPLLGMSIAISAMHTLYWGLLSQTDWNQRYNPDADLESSSGRTNWLTVGAFTITRNTIWHCRWPSSASNQQAGCIWRQTKPGTMRHCSLWDGRCRAI